MPRVIAALVLLATLAGCAVPRGPDASVAEVRRNTYSSGEAPSVTLFTVYGTRFDDGAHTGLMIDGAQRVLWDPAGSFRHPHVPERGDVLYGITPMIERIYIDYHVRPTHYMVEQEMPVTSEQATELIRLARQSGRSSQAMCAWTTSGILNRAGVDVGRTLFPDALRRRFGTLSGVAERRIDMNNVETDHNVVFGRGGVPTPPGA